MSVDEPNATYRHTLSSSDALAWEMLPRELTGLQKLIFVALLVLACAPVAMLPETWTAGALLWVWLAGAALVAYMVSRLVNRWAAWVRARARFPHPTEIIIEDWDHALTVTTGSTTRNIAFETILAVTRGRDHMFLPTGNDLVILPHRAISEADREALADRIATAIRASDGP